MEPSEDQIKELMTTVACAVCGVTYERGGVEVLGHRDALWFLRVSCTGCSTCGLVAAMVKAPEATAAADAKPAVETKPAPKPEPAGDSLDRARAPGPVRKSDVTRMRSFLESFDGDFQALFGSDTETKPHRPAA